MAYVAWPHEPAACDNPIFVLCAARTGSTLLRYILDSHPDIACPPETNLTVLISALHFSYHATTSSPIASEESDAHEMSRAIINRLFLRILRASGKSVWADKSLPNVEHASLLLRLYPNARFLCLYRECKDTVLSGIEACPWGYGGYGYAPYVQTSGSNHVAALAAYWADRTEAELLFEEEHPASSYRIRYEDLIASPNETIETMYSFLAADWSPEFAHESFILGRPHTHGAGDHNAPFLQAFDSSAIGRGWHIPIEMMPDLLQKRIDNIHEKLNYPALAAEPAPGDEAATSRILVKNTTELISRIRDRLPQTRTSRRLAAFRLYLVDEGKSWIVDPQSDSVTLSAQDASCTIRTDASTLLDLANCRLRPGTAIRHGLLQFAGDGLVDPTTIEDYARQLVGLVL